MKKMLCWLLIAIIMASCSLISYAATTPPDYAVGFISPDGYFEDEFGTVDISPYKKANECCYGDIIYYPLINTNYFSSGVDPSNTYIFVCEDAAVGSNPVIGKTIKQGENVVDLYNIKLVKKRVINSADAIRYYGISKTKNYDRLSNVYFIAVPIRSDVARNEQSVELSISITCGSSSWKAKASTTGTTVYTYVSNPVYDYKYSSFEGDTFIQTNSLTYGVDNGFSGTDEDILYFADSDGSYFEINTYNQKDLTLFFDTDYDVAIAATIEKTHPNVTLDFYNGNYAKFQRTGTLYLNNGFPGNYVYSIENDEYISFKRVDAIDEYEEGIYSFKTNTIGRYVVASENLDDITYLGLIAPPVQEAPQVEQVDEKQKEEASEPIAAETIKESLQTETNAPHPDNAMKKISMYLIILVSVIFILTALMIKIISGKRKPKKGIF